MDEIFLRATDPDRDFSQLSTWFSIFEDAVMLEHRLRDWYDKHMETITAKVAEDGHGYLLGFYWAELDKIVTDRINFDLYVEPEQRGRGLGSQLYADLLQVAKKEGIKTIQVRVKDIWPESRAFVERRGFVEIRHHFAMSLDLDKFDDRPYDPLLTRLEGEGFQFTSMQELGDTEDARRKLYKLNDTTAASTLGAECDRVWASFEDFQESVCKSDWYKPAGQIVAIDSTTGVWAGMSAITRFEGNDYAYNLFTGVDFPYRGRRLGQAVKVTALRFARQVLGVHEVRTHHNTQNPPMIAIDHKLGYERLSGYFMMEKTLE
jgi:GNAT superfamily N-acetyltransferase